MRIANTGRIAGARSAEQSVAFMRSGACASRHVSFVKRILSAAAWSALADICLSRECASPREALFMI